MKIEMKKGELNCIMTGTTEELQKIAENIFADLREDPEEEEEKVKCLTFCHGYSSTKYTLAKSWLKARNLDFEEKPSYGGGNHLTYYLTQEQVFELYHYITNTMEEEPGLTI